MQLSVNILLNFSLISLVGISFYYIFNTGKYYAIHHASIISLGGYFFVYLYKLSLSICLSILISVFITTILGVLIQKLILLEKKNIKIKSFYLIITSLGIYVIMQNLISIFFGDSLKIVNIKQFSQSIELYTSYMTVIQLIIIIINLSIIIGSLLLFKHTSFGRKMKAITNNETLSKILGINTNLIILKSFGIGSFIASISGILITLNVGMDNFSSFNLLFYGVIALIIGGIGNFRGLIVGALILALSQNFTAYYIDGRWINAVTYIILVLFLLWKPYGFSGKRLKKAEI